MNQLRDLVIKDTAAIQKWALVVDDILTNPVDKIHIKQKLAMLQTEEAILESLDKYQSKGGTNLVETLKKWELNTLASESARKPRK